MSKHSRSHDVDATLDQQFERLAAAQRNVTPHDQLVNSRSVDDAFWNGFEKPKPIQRAGILVYSGFLLVAALFFVSLAVDQRNQGGAAILWFLAVVFSAIAIKVGINAFRPRKKKRFID